MRNFVLETYFSKWEFTAKYHLSASDIESMSMADLLALASTEDRQAFAQLWLGYTQTYGHPELREEIAKTYEKAHAKNILCFAGAEEGLYIAMRVLLSAEDHAIVVVPNYQAAETLPLHIASASGVSLNREGGWSLDIEHVKKALRPNTKLISINFPNNPTGAVLEKSLLLELVEICRARGIYLFNDEVYRLVEREPSMCMPQVADIYEKGVSLNVMSKAYGMPGLRIGWIMTQDVQLLQKMERYKHYLSICNSAPSERLAIIALKAKEKILTKNRALLNSNLTILEQFFSEFPNLFAWQRPQGGCIAFPQYKGKGSTDQFCEDLVNQTGVLLLPPKVYHSELLEAPQDHFRIGFGRKNLAIALDVFRKYLAAI